MIRPLILLLSSIWAVTGHASSYASTLWQNVQTDYRQHYTAGPLRDTAMLITAGGVLANTGLDRGLQNLYDDHFSRTSPALARKRNHRHTILDHTLEPFKAVGGLKQAYIPLYMGMDYLFADSTHPGLYRFHEWGNRSLRTFLLGAPQQLALTYLTGASRPEDGDSRWHTFDGKRGVSGHAFYGAIPFLSLANMASLPHSRVLWTVLSTLPAASRLNDNKHYTSQVLLGWGIAYLSARSIDYPTQERKLSYQIEPLQTGAALSARLVF